MAMLLPDLALEETLCTVSITRRSRREPFVLIRPSAMLFPVTKHDALAWSAHWMPHERTSNGTAI